VDVAVALPAAAASVSADSGTVNALSSSSGAEAARAAVLARFEQNRREDRQRRALRGASEVQQILLQQESSCSKSTASAPGTPLASQRCSHSPNVSSDGQQLSSAVQQERQLSSIQQILADAQREREAASTAAAAAVASAKPEVAAMKAKVTTKKARVARIELKPQSKAAAKPATKAATKPASNLAAITVPTTMPKSAAKPADSTRSSAHSPQRRRLNFEGAVSPKHEALKASEASATKQVQSAAKAAPSAGLPAALQRLQQQQPHPPQQGTSQPQKPPATKPLPSQSQRPRSASPKRRLEVGAVRQAFENSMAQAWAADLRRYGADDCSSGKKQAYPAGGWDDRKTCPRFFSGRPRRLQPQQQPPVTTSLARTCSAPQVLRARLSEANAQGEPVVQAPGCTTSSEQCALSEAVKAPDTALSNGSDGGANDTEGKGVITEPVAIEPTHMLPEGSQATTDAGTSVSGTVLAAPSAVDTPEAICTSGIALAT